MNSIFMNDGTLVCYEFKSALIKDFEDNQHQEPGSHQSDQSSKIIVTVDRDTNMHLNGSVIDIVSIQCMLGWNLIAAEGNLIRNEKI